MSYVRLSVGLSGWNNSAPNGEIFMKFDVFVENISKNPSLINIGQE